MSVSTTVVIDPQLGAILQAKLNRSLNDEVVDGSERLFQASRQIAPHLLDNLLLILKKIGNGPAAEAPGARPGASIPNPQN